ncbi:MAG: A24 family peptidase, partial [Chloroflexi bacterium]|nr:A24 family peptidase [Chloroflexota bacterium]
IISSLAGLAVGYGFFFLVWSLPRLFKKSVLGYGDVGMAGLIGASVGFPHVLVALYIAILAGALTAAILILWKLKKFDEPLQFGVFLATGGLVALFWGSEIIDAYSMLLQ